MASFDSLLSSIHSGFSATDEGRNDIKKSIKIDAKRQFVPGEGFDTVIAYEGDIHSQIVSFWCEGYIDNHELYHCTNHELRWKNLVSGTEGTSKLTLVDPGIDKSEFAMMWEVPAEACTQAGTLEISISIYDKNKEDKVIFSWNTSKYSGLTVGGSLESVGFNFPAKNEILMIDRESKNIVAPVGYNNTICNYGETNVSEVYFLINRYIGKNKVIDVLDDAASITLYITMNGLFGTVVEGTNLTKKVYTEETNKNPDGLVFIKWKPTAGITAGKAGPNTMSVMVGVAQGSYQWFSEAYNQLSVKPSLFQVNIEGGAEWDLLENCVLPIIDNYITSTDFIIDANYENIAEQDKLYATYYTEGGDGIFDDLNYVKNTALHYLSRPIELEKNKKYYLEVNGSVIGSDIVKSVDTEENVVIWKVGYLIIRKNGRISNYQPYKETDRISIYAAK